MAEDKRMTLAEAIARFVPDGASVVMGAQMEQMIPFAAGHELIRQRRRELTLIGPISDALFDQLIGAGCVARVLAAWVGNVSEGLGYCLRRAIERGLPRPVEMVDFSNFTLAVALHAAALGVPFLPARTALGSDLLQHNPYLKVIECPFEQRPLLAVQALRPDVAILHVQRADAAGNAHLWGGLGVAVDAARAARAVILVAEEIVSAEDCVGSEPNADSGDSGACCGA
jgi:glutaconate CoA-transferase subunit A